MGYFKRFRQFYEDMYGPPFDNDYLLAESYSIEEDGQRLGALGSFYVSEALKVDPETEVDSAPEMDYAEHKNHFVLVYSDAEIGGKKFRVTLWETEYFYGKIADSPSRFNAESKQAVRDIVGAYHHVMNHVEPGFDAQAYNPIGDYFKK